MIQKIYIHNTLLFIYLLYTPLNCIEFRLYQAVYTVPTKYRPFLHKTRLLYYNTPLNLRNHCDIRYATLIKTPQIYTLKLTSAISNIQVYSNPL